MLGQQLHYCLRTWSTVNIEKLVGIGHICHTMRPNGGALNCQIKPFLNQSNCIIEPGLVTELKNRDIEIDDDSLDAVIDRNR